MWRPALFQKAEAALLDEKAAKLIGLARVLDQQLGAGFDVWLERSGVPADAPDQERLQALSTALRPLTDDLAAAFGAVGLGYYDARLDRIVAYAPSSDLGYLVGITPPDDHLGRMAMAERVDKVAVGSMVRGDAMNCMHPLVRGDQVIGFAFANESLEQIYRQIHGGRSRSYQTAELAAVLGLSSLAVYAGTSATSAGAIRAELTAAVQRGVVAEEAVRPLLLGLGQIEQYIRMFLDNLQAGAVLVGPTGLVEYCSPAMGRLLKVEAQSITQRSWAEVVAGAGLSPDQMVVADILAAPQPDTGGGEPHRLILFEDASVAQREADYFERAERLALAGELATAIAHEIRNPLTVVAGSVQLIPQRLDDREFLLSLSQIAGRELARVNRTIQGLLGFARYSEPQMALLDVNELVTQAVEFIRWYAVKHGVEVEISLQPGRLQVWGDAEHLQQALLNLMINGIQAMPSGGTLALRTEHPGGSRFVRVMVRDRGPGIEPDQLRKIWEVFYSSKPGGTGLGLPVVQRIVDEHRGQVQVESAPGQGTCFTVLLPLTTRADARGEE